MVFERNMQINLQNNRKLQNSSPVFDNVIYGKGNF